MTHIHFHAAPDGARLAFRQDGAGLPVIALSGLTRNHHDFDYLLPHLPEGVRLIRPDYRGRGASEWTGAETYTVAREAQDVLALMDHLMLERAAILGTSRGGLIAMLLAATAGERLSGVCLNDIGPELDPGGLERIGAYVGRNPAGGSLADLAARLPALMPGFSDVPPERWATEAARHYIETPEGLRINYDPELRAAFLKAFEGPPADLWPLFDAMEGLPLCLIRGENSDLLTAAAAARMRARRPDMIFAAVPGRAHIPFLDEPEALAAIETWLRAVAARFPPE